VGILRTGQITPSWFPHDTQPVRAGDLGMIFRAPKSDGLSAPTCTDDDLEILFNEKDLQARLAVHKGLEEAW